MEYKTDLLLMGYRPLGTNEHGVTVSAKHFGYTLLVIAIKGDDLTLAQHFKGFGRRSNTTPLKMARSSNGFDMSNASM